MDRVLSIDDSEEDRQFIRRCLSPTFIVDQAGSGEEGLSLLQQCQDYSVIIADYRLPGITGLEFLERAEQMISTAGRLLITGDPSVERGTIHVVTLFKPVPPDALIRFVGQLASLSARAIKAKAGRITSSAFPAIPLLPDPKKR